jgi:hypothetical protein
VRKIDSHLFHSSCCWAVDTFNSTQSVYSNQNQLGSSSNVPVDSFITCSTDNTLRIWSPVTHRPNHNNTSPTDSKLKTNIYSKELLKVIYIDNDLSALCDQTLLTNTADNSDAQSTLSNAGQSNNPFNSAQTFSNNNNNNNNVLNSTNLPLSTITNLVAENSTTSSSLKLGARCLKINPFGTHLATGDRNGNIRIYDLTSHSALDSKTICMIEAHDGEILYLQYSQPESGRLLLASSSRDRLIHIFDASRVSYDLLQTLDDHSAAITAVRFYFNRYKNEQNSAQTKMMRGRFGFF